MGSFHMATSLQRGFSGYDRKCQPKTLYQPGPLEGPQKPPMVAQKPSGAGIENFNYFQHATQYEPA